ncbi:hypothetical protein U0070_022686 [Myodes glareolus]|uniref:Uncharacterized protein n=1 Tax=Myodes glareolus TaxID=447135 RepID=A0AAW0I1M8_MYOGA
MDTSRVQPIKLARVQEGEHPNRLDPQKPAYAEETGPSVIVNGFSERPRASHSQRIRPNSENLARSLPRSVPVRLALQRKRCGNIKFDIMDIIKFDKD